MVGRSTHDDAPEGVQLAFATNRRRIAQAGQRIDRTAPACRRGIGNGEPLAQGKNCGRKITKPKINLLIVDQHPGAYDQRAAAAGSACGCDDGVTEAGGRPPAANVPPPAVSFDCCIKDSVPRLRPCDSSQRERFGRFCADTRLSARPTRQ